MLCWSITMWRFFTNFEQVFREIDILAIPSTDFTKLFQNETEFFIFPHCDNETVCEKSQNMPL